MKAVASDRSARQVDLENFDYAGLRVKPNSVWVVQLALMGYQDANNRFTDNDVGTKRCAPSALGSVWLLFTNCIIFLAYLG